MLNDPGQQWATVSGQAFRIIVKVVRADGSTATGYRCQVVVSVDNGSGGKITLAAHTYAAADAGVYQFSGLTLRSVYDHNATRTLYADDNVCNIHGQTPVAVWFYVMSTKESPQSTACGTSVGPDSRMVALPYDASLCNVGVRLLTAGGSSVSTTVEDRGPWFPAHWDGASCSSYPPDPYWNGTGVPRAQGMIGQKRQCDPSSLSINGSGIDLGPATYSDLGSPGWVYWRFD